MTLKEWKIARAAELGITVPCLSMRLSKGKEPYPAHVRLNSRCIDVAAKIYECQICHLHFHSAAKRPAQYCPACRPERHKAILEKHNTTAIGECACGQPAIVRYQGEKVCARCRVLDRLTRTGPSNQRQRIVGAEAELNLQSEDWTRFAEQWEREERARMGALRLKFNQFDAETIAKLQAA